MIKGVTPHLTGSIYLGGSCMTTVKNPLEIKLSGQFEISHGPGKWDLTMSLLDNTVEKPRYALFTVNVPADATEPHNAPVCLTKVLVCLNALEREDGSGERWNFKGFNPKNGQKTEGYFNLLNRKGWIKFL